MHISLHEPILAASYATTHVLVIELYSRLVYIMLTFLSQILNLKSLMI